MTYANPSSGRVDHLPASRHQDERPIYLCDGLIVRRCLLTDRSEDGGTVCLSDNRATLPSQVVLVDPHTGRSDLAAVVWRSETEVGVRFLRQGARYRVLRSTADLAWKANIPDRRCL
jgi:hypothetical protein